jgi:hypothetical protein
VPKIAYIPPNFGVKEFRTGAEAGAFLKKFGFGMIRSRANYEVWETTKQPKRRALSFQDRVGIHIAVQLVPRSYLALGCIQALAEML